MATKAPKQLTRQLVEELSDEIQKALLPLTKKYGLSFQVGSGSFNSTTAKLAIEIAVPVDGSSTGDKNAHIKARAAANWVGNAKNWDLDPKAVGRIVTIKGKEMKLAGLLPRRKLPVLFFPVDSDSDQGSSSQA